MAQQVGRTLIRLGLVIIGMLLAPSGSPAQATFAPGDVFVSFEDGTVQWRHSDGTLYAVLNPGVPGSGEGMRFDAAGSLYVTHWCTNSCASGNTIEKFNTSGVSTGAVGSGYLCNPHALTFDATGDAYVGQADCAGNILKQPFGAPSSLCLPPPVAYTVAVENRGAFWVDLASDNCTIFYTSWGPDVLRFDVCAGTQLAIFNQAPLPGGEAHDLRLLPGGGLIVATGAVVSRLDSRGNLIQTYQASTGEPQYWAGLDLVGDGTFWAVNQYASNVYRFDLASGAVVGSFNTGTPPITAVAVVVSRGGCQQ
jgi:hypothetical protein